MLVARVCFHSTWKSPCAGCRKNTNFLKDLIFCVVYTVTAHLCVERTIFPYLQAAFFGWKAHKKGNKSFVFVFCLISCCFLFLERESRFLGWVRERERCIFKTSTLKCIQPSCDFFFVFLLKIIDVYYLWLVNKIRYVFALAWRVETKKTVNTGEFCELNTSKNSDNYIWKWQNGAAFILSDTIVQNTR